MSDTITLYEWVEPSEFTPENGWVQDLVDSGRLRERTFRRPDWYQGGKGPKQQVVRPDDNGKVWVEVDDE